MTTATFAPPGVSLVSDAYADLAADLRALAARVVAAPETLSPWRATVSVEPALADTGAPTSRHLARRIFVVALDLVLTFIVLPVLAFHVAFQLFPPPR